MLSLMIKLNSIIYIISGIVCVFVCIILSLIIIDWIKYRKTNKNKT
jgi:tellurite resistance protein TehA-like permease